MMIICACVRAGERMSIVEKGCMCVGVWGRWHEVENTRLYSQHICLVDICLGNTVGHQVENTRRDICLGARDLCVENYARKQYVGYEQSRNKAATRGPSCTHECTIRGEQTRASACVRCVCVQRVGSACVCVRVCVCVLASRAGLCRRARAQATRTTSTRVPVT
jgi:hypothetical protein